MKPRAPDLPPLISGILTLIKTATQAIIAIKGKEGLNIPYLREWAPKLVEAEDGRMRQLNEWIKKLA